MIWYLWVININRTQLPLPKANRRESSAFLEHRDHFDVIGYRIIYDINCHIMDWLSAPSWRAVHPFSQWTPALPPVDWQANYTIFPLNDKCR